MLDDLLLLRLWAAPDAARGETRSRVAPDLRPLAADPAQGAESWRATFAAATERLAKAGFLAVDGRQGARLRLSDAGRSRVRAVFQITQDRGPARSGRPAAAGWAWWRDHHALPLALGGERPDAADDLRCALLRRFFAPDLPAPSGGGRLRTVVDLLLARRLQAPRSSPAAFRQAVLRDWVRQAPPTKADAPAPGDQAAGLPARLPEGPARFAAAVRAAAARSRGGRFGENKVFVAHVWRELLASGAAAPEEADSFKERLIRANTAGRLHLSRADLAGAHDARDVRASELEYLGEKFHFVRLD